MSRKRKKPHREAEVAAIAAKEAASAGEPMFELVEPRAPDVRVAQPEDEDERVIESYRQMLIEDPSNVALRLQLGQRYEKRGDHVLALEQFEAARAQNPDDIDVLVRVASALGAMGRFDRAERELRRAIKLAPERPEPVEALGLMQFRRGSYIQAEADLKRALELDPDRPLSLFHRGEALNHLGRVDEALEMLERAVMLNPRNPKAYFTMGILYDRKHLREEAQAMYRKAREIGDA